MTVMTQFHREALRQLRLTVESLEGSFLSNSPRTISELHALLMTKPYDQALHVLVTSSEEGAREYMRTLHSSLGGALASYDKRTWADSQGLPSVVSTSGETTIAYTSRTLSPVDETIARLQASPGDVDVPSNFVDSLPDHGRLVYEWLCEAVMKKNYIGLQFAAVSTREVAASIVSAATDPLGWVYSAPARDGRRSRAIKLPLTALRSASIGVPVVEDFPEAGVDQYYWLLQKAPTMSDEALVKYFGSAEQVTRILLGRCTDKFDQVLASLA